MFSWFLQTLGYFSEFWKCWLIVSACFFDVFVGKQMLGVAYSVTFLMSLSDIVLSTKLCGSLLWNIVVSCGCHNQWSQTLLLKTTEIHSPIVVEARNLKPILLGWNQVVGRAVLPPEVLRENPFLASSNFQQLPEFLAYGHITTSSFVWLISLCLSLRTDLMALKAHLDHPG